MISFQVCRGQVVIPQGLFISEKNTPRILECPDLYFGCLDLYFGRSPHRHPTPLGIWGMGGGVGYGGVGYWGEPGDAQALSDG